MTGKLGTVETHPGLTLYLGRLGWNRKMITTNRSIISGSGELKSRLSDVQAECPGAGPCPSESLGALVRTLGTVPTGGRGED